VYCKGVQSMIFSIKQGNIFDEQFPFRCYLTFTFTPDAVEMFLQLGTSYSMKHVVPFYFCTLFCHQSCMRDFIAKRAKLRDEC